MIPEGKSAMEFKHQRSKEKREDSELAKLRLSTIWAIKPMLLQQYREEQTMQNLKLGCRKHLVAWYIL